MSSELIGELGQVGLTIGGPVVQQTTEDEGNQPVDEGMSDDSAVSGPGEPKRARTSTNRPKRFRSAWMMFDIFKDWLRPHPNPEWANCIVCNRVIKAGKSELEKHATGKRHLKMLKEQQQQGIVLINSGDSAGEMETYTLDGWCDPFEKITNRAAPGTTVGAAETDAGLAETPLGVAETQLTGDDSLRRVKGVSKRRIQRYRRAWEEDPEFSVWLSAHPSPYKAICDVCDKIMVADVTVIRQHAISKKHLISEKTYFKSKQQAPLRQSEVLVTDKQRPAASDAESATATGNEGGKQQFIMYRDIEHQYSAEGTNTSAVDSSYAGIYVPVQQDRVMKSEGEREPTREDNRLFVTKPAPHWRGTAIVNGHVTRLDINDYKGRYVVLFFYAHNFSKVDASEINRLSDRIVDFRNVHTEIVACSTDSHLSHLTWVKKSRGEGGVAGVKIPLIADPTHVIAKEYGVYVQSKGHCLRAHFVIDRRGILRHMAINDPLIGRGTDELLRIVKALQFSDQAEEPLVADWMPDA